MSHDELVVLRNFPDEMQAELAKGLLAAEGIQAATRHVHSVVDDVLPSVDLLVQPADLENAESILDDMNVEGTETPDEEP